MLTMATKIVEAAIVPLPSVDSWSYDHYKIQKKGMLTACRS